MIYLDDLNKDDTKTFTIEYSMAKEYNIKDISVKSLSDLATRLSKDDKLFEKYINYNSVLYNLPKIDDDMKYDIIEDFD